MTDFDVQTTAYGRPATELLGTQVTEAKGGDRLAPVSVVVASNYAAVSTRRALAGRPGGIANVSFLTLHRLAERLGATALEAAGRRPLSSAVVALAVRAVLAEAPGVFRPVADHPSTELALVAATRELAGIAEDALDAVAACSRRAADVVRITRRVRFGLAPSWHDEHDLVRAATAAVAGGAPVGPVVIHLMQDLSPAGAGFLRALADQGPVRVNVGITGDPDADRHVLEVHRRAGVGVGPTGIGRPCATGIVSVSDPDEEVRTAIRLVTAWMGEGVPLAGVAVLYAVADPYARLLHEQLAAAGLVHNGAPVRAAGEMVFGRTLLRLLGLGDRSFRRSDVLAVVTGTPPADGGGRAPSRAWERISRAASVVDGPDWDRRLATFADTARRRATEAERVEQESLAGHLRRDGERATQLACFVRGLRGELETLASADSWTALVEGTHRLMDRHLGDESHRRSWPDEEQKAADRVEQALDSLAGLDSIGGPAPNLDTFRHTLEGELETALPRFGRFGDGVLVGHVSMAVGLELERVIVLGMAEGAFPARRREDSLLPDDERRAAGGELRLRRDLVHDDLRQLLAAVAAAREATLCFPRGDLRRQGDRAASRWLLVDAARLAGRPALFTADLANPATRSGDWFIHVPSHASGLVRGVLPATAQDLRLATMLRDPVKVIANDPGLALGMELARARRSESFTRFDGNLAGLDLPDYAASGVVSATRLESWAVCPYAFLMRYLLKVEVADDPERTLEMNPLDKGSLVHEVLDRFVTEAVTSGRNPPWTDQDNSHLAEIADEVCRKFHDRGATGRAMFWRRDRVRIRADLQRFAGMDDRHPLYSERRFEDLAYPLPDGRSVKFRGTIDRIDRSPDGSAAVTDYKTGGTRGYQGLSAEDPHQGGRHLQLAVYAAAAREPGGSDVEAEYWFVTTKGNFRRIGYRVTDAVRHEVGNALSTIVDGIRSGVFPARPTADPSYVHVDCWYCSPDGLNSAERRRDWERKRSHPSLKRYRALCEPEVAR